MKRRKDTLSIVIPLYNEEKNIPLLYQKLRNTLALLPNRYEIIFVDDGSTDNSLAELKKISRDKRIKVIRLHRNYGQTNAISAGIDHSKYSILILMDADLQNDPADIPNLLKQIETGFDVVSGWRRYRRDNLFTKKIPSQIANSVLAFFLKLPLHDIGCTLKAYRKNYLIQSRLYGEMHRLLPYIAYMEGARITEIEVKHHPRRFGTSHYTLDRTFKVIIDMIMLKLYYGYSNKPAYLFGGLGLLLFGVSILLSLFTLWERFYLGVYVHRNPIFLLSMFSFTASIQFMLLGFLTEFIMRTYYESQGKSTYRIKQTINL